ncbi:peroxisomal membrane anchor protein [Phanerochaete sordida]|uniref:Peroxisomal membrane protein PEX14 n=1 Tax=Phanerochaete sordida TaxID=48140 RepID=A0A9P3G3V1_9APHY|nr:peroxisomal membrane anchor protein [Phanerochaete sordida]
MASPERQELLRNAVAFLKDPKTQASPLAQRVQFLEAKGLSNPEIEEAMRQAAVAQPIPYTSSPSYGPYPPAYGPMPYGAQPPQPWDWRDYFITAVVSGTIAYGAVALFKKYVKPHLTPPSATAYEEDRDALTAQFDAAEAMLKDIQAETTAVRRAVEEQKEKIEKTTQDVQNVVQEMRKNEEQTRSELKEVQDEVQAIRDLLPKMVEKSKDAHTQSLAELQQELKSLKTLLLTRGPSGVSGTATPVIPSKPSIPAWQLAGSNHLSNGSLSLPASPGSIVPPAASSPVNSKGKEVDTSPS